MDAILFTHYKPLSDPVTRKHLILFKALNPDAEVIPLKFEAGRNDSDWQWRNCDLLVYEWFTRTNPKHERIFIFEWDTFCTMPVKEFYGEAYNYAATAANIVKPWLDDKMPTDNPLGQETMRTWLWLPQNCSEEIRPYIRGMVPTCGSMFSNEALRGMVELWKTVDGFADLFCECRLGTLACMAGYEPRQISPEAKKFLAFYDVGMETVRGIHHRVRA